MYIPGPGEFRLLPDVCSNMAIKNALFENHLENQKIVFDDDYV